MRNLLIAVVAVGMLAGCGGLHRSQTISARPGGSDAQLLADQNACRQQAVGQADTKSMPTWGQTMNHEVYDDCLRARGYDVDSFSASPGR